MIDTLISDHREDIQLKPLPSVSGTFSLPSSRFSKSESSDSSRKLRILMNKVTDNNFQKLIDDLVESQVFDEKLINEYLKLVFERTSVKGSSDLFINVLSYFSHRLKLHNQATHKVLKACLQTRILQYSLAPDSNASTWGKFVGNLVKERLVKFKTIGQVLDEMQAQSETSESLIEATCPLLEVCSPYFCSEFSCALNKAFVWMSGLNREKFSKKIQFLIENFIEQKEKLLTPAHDYLPRFSVPAHQSRPGKKVSFSGNCDFIPVISNKTKRILKHTVSEESKNDLKSCVSEYVKGKKDLAYMKGIFEICKNQERQLVYQIFKYTLIQFSREQEFSVICEMISCAHEKFLNKCVIETGMAYTVEAIDDIKLDTPLAPQYLKSMIESLKEKGIIENPQYLFDHLNRIEEGKFCEYPENTH